MIIRGERHIADDIIPGHVGGMPPEKLDYLPGMMAFEFHPFPLGEGIGRKNILFSEEAVFPFRHPGSIPKGVGDYKELELFGHPAQSPHSILPYLGFRVFIY